MVNSVMDLLGSNDRSKIVLAIAAVECSTQNSEASMTDGVSVKL